MIPLALDTRLFMRIIALNRRAFPTAWTEESRLALVAREARQAKLGTALNPNQLKFPPELLR